MLFETNVYAENTKAVKPFKIVVEETKVGNEHTVTVKRIEYDIVGRRLLENETILNVTFWKE